MSEYETLQDLLHGAERLFMEGIIDELGTPEALEQIGTTIDIAFDEENLEIEVEAWDANEDVRCHLDITGFDEGKVGLHLFHSMQHSRQIYLPIQEVTVERVVRIMIEFLRGQTLPSQQAV
jgi:hypothetical protein